MKMRIQLIIEDDFGGSNCANIAAIERHPDDLIGLSLEEAKAMTSAVRARWSRPRLERRSIAARSVPPVSSGFDETESTE